MDAQVLELMFDAIKTLTHESHLHRTFNLKQLEAADVSKHLLNAFLVKEYNFFLLILWL